MTASLDLAEVSRSLALLHEQGQTLEVRILEVTNATFNGKPDSRLYPVVSGYFRDTETAAKEIGRVLTGARFKGAYATLNGVDPALYSRAAGRLKPAGKDPLTTDKDVPLRRKLLVDLDCKRPAGISATDEEHAAALELARKIRDAMTTEQGWPEPILADSGNGAHLLWEINLPADDAGLVSRVLARLQIDFGGNGVSVDQTVFNPARITKIYGTLAGKGDSTPERPHRMSRILEVPPTIEPVPVDLLEKYAGPAVHAAPKTPPTSHGGTDIEKAVSARWPDAPKKEREGGVFWELSPCPWDETHTTGGWFARFKSGAFDGGCRHDSCSGKGWPEFKRALGIETARPKAVEQEPVILEWLENEAVGRPKLSEKALYGLAGDFVRTITPFTEADPAGVLLATLIEFGCAVGYGPHFYIGNTRHGTAEFGLLVGHTGVGRKGTAQDEAEYIFTMAGPEFCPRIASGLSSGEGLIHQVRDQSMTTDEDAVETIKDPGVADKRLLIRESEFAKVLKVVERQGNTLSPIIRLAWDGKRLETLIKNSPDRATDPHISIIAHVTPSELRRLLTESEVANGFANRFIAVFVERERLLPDGDRIPQERLVPLANRLQEAIAFGQTVGEMTRTEAARKVWRRIYAPLTGNRTGMRGALTDRAAQHVVRLSMMYALLDQQDQVDVPHLLAATALWGYAEASIGSIFGASLGDSVADDLAAELKNQNAGMSRTQIRDHFNRHVPANRIEEALAILATSGVARKAMVRGTGRPEERWFFGIPCDRSDRSDQRSTGAA